MYFQDPLNDTKLSYNTLGHYLTILRRYLDFDHLKSLDLSVVASAPPTIEAGKGVKDECQELLKI